MLSNYFWEEVFKHLDGKSLKNAALVCKDWNEIIGQSPALMRKFALRLAMWNKWASKVDEIVSLSRKFQEMAIFISSDEEVAAFVKIAERHGAHIKKFNFNKQSFNFEALKAFKYFPALKELKIEQFQLKNPSSKELSAAVDLIELTQLKQLKLTLWTSWLVFKSFRCPNLYSLTITLEFETEPREYLLNFLSNTTKLEFLDIGECAIINIFSSEESTKLKLPLKTLNLSSNKVLTEEVGSKLARFLDNHSLSLETIHFNGQSETVGREILMNIKRLRYLKISSKSLSQVDEFYENLRPVESLRMITTEQIPHKGLLGNCPNLEVLNVKQNLSKILPFLVTYNPQLKAIETQSFDLDINLATKFNLKNLKYLNVEYFRELKVLSAFLKNHLSLETVCLRYIEDVEIFKVLSKMTNLKHLKFGGETDDMKEFFTKSYNECKKLETLEIIFEKIPGRPDVLFKFPEDAGKLLEKCPYVAEYKKTPDTEFGYRISVCHTSEFIHAPLAVNYISP